MFGLNRELFAPTAGLTYPTRTVLSPPVRVHVVGLVQAITPDYQNSWLRFKGASLPPVSSLRLHPLLASIKLAWALVSLAYPQCIESKSLFGHFAGIWCFLSRVKLPPPDQFGVQPHIPVASAGLPVVRMHAGHDQARPCRLQVEKQWDQLSQEVIKICTSMPPNIAERPHMS